MKKITSINPTTGKVLGEVSATSANDITEKVKAARAAASLWKSLGTKKRIEILVPLEEILKKKKNEIAELISKEIGKPITESLGDFASDFIYLNDFLKQGASYISDEIIFKNRNETHRIIYEPTGVVACIVPWNFPLGNFIWSVIPNLIVGNTVIFKHAEECALTAKLLEDIMLLLDLPQGVFSTIYGDAKEGCFLAEENIDMIWFTGSSDVGSLLAATAGKKQIKVVLELGGSNPAIIMEDAEIDHFIEKIYQGRFFNCGQVCDAIKRLIVHHTLFDKVVEALAKRLLKIIIGDPLNAETELGPLASLSHFQKLDAQVKDAVEKNATVIIGGKQPDGFSGAYFSPTILTNITKNMRVWQEEVFGPVLPVVSFKNDNEAIQLANDTAYGLGAFICTKNRENARHLAGQIEAGYVEINHGNHWQPCTPFGGYKSSGMGREHGRHGFQELCRMKVIAEG